MDAANLNAVVCLGVLFSIFFFCSGGHKLLSDSVLQETVSNFLGQVVCKGWGCCFHCQGTTLFECEGTHTCVFLSHLLFDVASCFSGTQASFELYKCAQFKKIF